MSANEEVMATEADKLVEKLTPEQRRVVISDVDGTITLLEGQISFTQIKFYHYQSADRDVKVAWMGMRVHHLLGDELYQAVWASASSGEENALKYLRFDHINASNLTEEHKQQIKDKLLRHDLVAQLKKIQTQKLGTLYIVSMSHKATVGAVLEHADLLAGRHFCICLARVEKVSRAAQANFLIAYHTESYLGIDASKRKEALDMPRYIELIILDDSDRCIAQMHSPVYGIIKHCTEIESQLILQPQANVIDSDIVIDLSKQIHQWRFRQVKQQLPVHHFFSDKEYAEVSTAVTTASSSKLG